MISADPTVILGDGKRLADILALAGPDTAPLILRQMELDLAAVEAAISPALRSRDWTAIRAQTHVLISLAGTIGADRLHAAAIDLNVAAHDRAEAHVTRLGPPLLSDLAHLRAALAGRDSPQNVAP
ncbi:hypothetical protein [Fuscovulum ytuae]|uniref:HPt domain-containing protein n=1 Tax=Fuscovulum ytuae TaxID=3042299 RepID=A0ABY8Q693_9RHOB|nr:hypothetical protein [Fuscovulum sp. YMD61]WGV16204.1 hypothetical protein QF092_18470 [Fuscovulum sp. YMD61]